MRTPSAIIFPAIATALSAFVLAETGKRAFADGANSGVARENQGEKEPEKKTGTGETLEWIIVGEDARGFVRKDSGKAFTVWGVNYDHDEDGRLLEDYWETSWSTVEEDFREIRALGANTVRIHLQVARFMKSAGEANPRALSLLARLLRLAEETELYLDITGLGCYHKKDVPEWYDALNESGRWATQARFWEAVAKTCASSPAVFCYDLMNEPILPGARKAESEWLAGEFGGKHFVQRISLDLAGRTREEVAHSWVKQLRSAIRRHDTRHLITVGVIPWSMVWPKARPIFYSPRVLEELDFVSAHFYPEKEKVDRALAALSVYAVGKPLVIEETFPLKCSEDELEDFIRRSRRHACGWISFYWGTTAQEYAKREKPTIADAIKRKWLERFREMAKTMTTNR